MKFCHSCGSQLSDNAKFCNKCGTSQVSQVSNQPQQYGPQQYGPQQYGPQQYGPQQYGPQQYGPQQYGQQPQQVVMNENFLQIKNSILTCLNKYAVFTGRANRQEYWWFFLFVFVVGLVPYAGQIASLGLFIPVIAVGIRRMHDVGKSGWWLLCPIYSIVLLASEGSPQPNEYGSPCN